MEYSINEMSKLSKVTTRTLRYYDEIGLLSPKRLDSNYRVYSQNEVNLLQQILFFRELGVPLEEIKKIILSEEYERESALQAHFSELNAKKTRIELLIGNVEKTIAALKGESVMSDKEKFEGFKENLIAENEAKYGKEIREKYGDESVDASNAKMMGLTAEQYKETEKLSNQINENLKLAFEEGNPAGESAQTVCAMHKEWICYFWGTYSKEAHFGLTQTYVDDSRFREYYDAIAVGCAEFLRDAMKIFCEQS